MTKWTRQPEECKGKYFFSGHLYVTAGVAIALSAVEILSIFQVVQDWVKQNNGADYLQVFTDEKGRKLFLIDQLSKPMIESGEFSEEDNYCVLLWASEY